MTTLVSTSTATKKTYDMPFVRFVRPASETRASVHVKPGGSATIKVETLPGINVYNVSFVASSTARNPDTLPSARSGSDGIASWRLDFSQSMALGVYYFTAEVRATDPEVSSQLRTWSSSYDPRFRDMLTIYVEQ